MSIIIAMNTASQDSNEMPRVMHTTCKVHEITTTSLIAPRVFAQGLRTNLTLRLLELGQP